MSEVYTGLYLNLNYDLFQNMAKVKEIPHTHQKDMT